jgi:hypothetical protein
MGAAASVAEGTLEEDTVGAALVKGVESALSQAINRSVAAHPEWKKVPPARSELLQSIAKEVSVTAAKQVGGKADGAFDLADADKDGKLTPEEFGAMLQAEGFVLSSKRSAMLFGALDENGDGSLDLAEFSKGLELLAAVAGALLERQHPSQPAVAAGVIAVGSRLDKNNYDEEMKEWARDPQRLLPKAVLLQANVAAIQAIGPLYLQQHLEQKQIDELTKAVEALKEGDVSALTMTEHQLAEAIERKEKVVARLAEAVAHVDSVKLASAEAISPGLARDAERYTEALTKLVADEPGVLDEVSAEAAALVNTGALKVDDEVEVVDGGAMQRAKVRRVIDQAGDGTYELSLWSEIRQMGEKYEVGFDTSAPKRVTLPRRGIYANTKHKQAVNPSPNANPSLTLSLSL